MKESPASREERKRRRILADEAKIEKLQSRLRTLGERSTFHGVDVLLEAKAGWNRRLVILILLGMCVACFYTVSDLIAGFINMPISTVINYGKADFTFPTVTICPDSPFSVERLLEHEKLTKIYRDTVNFWISQAGPKSTPDPARWPPADGYWRQKAKRTFRSHFLANRSRLMWAWKDLIVGCEYEGVKCNIDPTPVQMPIAVMPPQTETSAKVRGTIDVNWPGRGFIKPVSAFQGPELPPGWPGEEPSASAMNTEPTKWPRDKVIIVDHPSKYYCYQLRMETRTVKEPGSTKGLHLLLRRPYDRKRTQPALLSVESRAALLQAWDDRLFLDKTESLRAKRDAGNAVALDGFHILIHQDTDEEYMGKFSVEDVSKAGSSRSVVSLGVRFGQQASIGMSQFVHQRLSTVYRPCNKKVTHHRFLELSSFYTSGGFARRYFQLDYSWDNCVSQVRQLIMIHRCGCLSEDYMVPLQFAGELLRVGFCHSSSPRIPSHSSLFKQRSACHEEVSSLTREQVLNMAIPRSWGIPILIKLNDEIQRLWICPKYCKETISQAEVIQRHAIPADLPKQIAHTERDISSSDLVAVTIYATSARVPAISEGEQANIFNLLASIGGTFGLFLGLSGVTLFEVIEGLTVVLMNLPALLRNCFRGMHRTKKVLQRFSKTTGDTDVTGKSWNSQPLGFE
ncbi:unnamed protein product [Calicophoron daubneyi]|uniref:Uncharacterized protein n=1 Tax=Calicophoron daubneyi TaxID=300641 RepID=A0AAV2TCE2_CALDB